MKKIRLLLETMFREQKYWQDEARCPFMLCPTNQPFRGAKRPRMKFIQKIAPTIYQYRCKDCGCAVNFGLEVINPQYGEKGMADKNPALVGFEPSYNLKW